VGFGHIRLFGPHPTAGTTVDGVVRFRSITNTTVVADMQLARQGQVWAHEDGRGRHRVTGTHGRTLPSLDVSLGHCPGVGVAIARPHVERYGSGVGIAVEEITERGDRELSAEETSLLAARRAETGQPAALWLTRFRTAKEVVLKAEGPGLDGRPKSLVVVEASATELDVRAHCARSYKIEYEQLSNPESHGKHHYVVALTTSPGSGKGCVG
jgi:hypothetical protein